MVNPSHKVQPILDIRSRNFLYADHPLAAQFLTGYFRNYLTVVATPKMQGEFAF